MSPVGETVRRQTEMQERSKKMVERHRIGLTLTQSLTLRPSPSVLTHFPLPVWWNPSYWLAVLCRSQDVHPRPLGLLPPRLPAHYRPLAAAASTSHSPCARRPDLRYSFGTSKHKTSKYYSVAKHLCVYWVYISTLFCSVFGLQGWT